MLQQELAPCACGGRIAAASPAFSLLLPMHMGLPAEHCYDHCHVEEGGSPYDVAGAPVDCTLSLGTPSTRRADAAGVAHARGGGGCAGAGAGAADPNQGSPPRRCANCDTASTPLWRNGPRGPKSLCNACGIRYKKEQRRATAAVAPATQDSGVVRPYACGGYARPPPQQQQEQQWGCYSAASYGMYGGDVGVVNAAAAADGSCLSWMLNAVPSSPAFAVRESHTLFQYY